MIIDKQVAEAMRREIQGFDEIEQGVETIEVGTRIWTLGWNPQAGHLTVSGPALGNPGDVPRGGLEVYEAEPVDAERQRMLDLLERLFKAYAMDGAMDPEIGIPVEVLLREHGRLSGENQHE